MPRILLLITDLEIGGTPTVVRELALRLRSPTTHIEVASLKGIGPIGEQLIAAGVSVHAFDARRAWQLQRVVRELRTLVRAHEIDVVFSFLVHANLVAHRAARKLLNVRFLQSIQTTQPRPGWHWKAQRIAAASAARVVVPSASVARVARERSGVPIEKLLVIPNAVDADKFRSIRGRPTDQPGASALPFRVGFVGRLDPVKRVDDLIAAMTFLDGDRYRLDIWGEGSERERLESSAGSRATFHGAIADAREAYANLDVLVLPSDAEGFGLVLIEAMAAGVPVIGTDVDGIRDVVDHERTGLLVPPRNPAVLAAAIGRIVDDSELRNRLIANAHNEVEQRFAWPAVLASYREVLQIEP